MSSAMANLLDCLLRDNRIAPLQVSDDRATSQKDGGSRDKEMPLLKYRKGFSVCCQYVFQYKQLHISTKNPATVATISNLS